MNWKYAMIKVTETTTGEFIEKEDVCELVEIFQSNNSGKYTSFSKPFLTCPKDLALANKDVQEDGVNTWFWDNGKFSWNTSECFWDWKKHG